MSSILYWSYQLLQAWGAKDGLAFQRVNWVIENSQEERCELNMYVK